MTRSQEEPRFVVVIDEHPPVLHDAAGLAREVAWFAEDSHYGWGNVHHIQVWRWAGDGHLEPLTVRCTATGRLTFDDQDYAHPVWVVAGPDGHEHVSVGVRIDGRA